MPISSSIKPHFDASSLSAETLLKKKIFTLIFYEKLFDCGMPVTGMYDARCPVSILAVVASVCIYKMDQTLIIIVTGFYPGEGMSPPK